MQNIHYKGVAAKILCLSYLATPILAANPKFARVFLLP
ncbi:CobQ-like glutamine amidotransferase family enzyme [Edaphobacter lichenicola]|uniref:CobQ-like glutamine amidotransferase family enzyme n=1 Tax=Tunturiibacter lichenicola TaxID=2051959 RepID=A0A7Y9NM24_9BACT|nr:CobQ-like glutamine amidotransferase family enzyme [Edaphobacter lichenicola]